MRGHPQRTSRAAGLTGWLLAGVLVALAAPPAEATVREWLMFRDRINPGLLASSPPTRLAGMGYVDLCVPDESNEINVRDFGRNVAGVLEDADSWVIETWYGSSRQHADVPGQHSQRSYGQAGSQAVYRSERTALGGDLNWTFYEVSNTPGDWARVRGPLPSGIINQRFGRFILGVTAGAEKESESRHSGDFFAVQHEQTRWIGQVGLTTRLGAWDLALGWDFDRGDVLGWSVDPVRFHEDTFVWSRSRDRWSAAVILPARQGIEVGLRARYMDRTGGEIEQVSWSAVSPENPSKEIYQAKGLVTFTEDETDLDAAVEVRIDVGAATIGMKATYRSWEWTVIEGRNFKGSNREGSWSSDVLAAGLGGSTRTLGGRLLVAAQAEGALQDWHEAEGLSDQKAKALLGRASAGLELFIHEDVALRGGLWLGAHDRDRDAPLTLSQERGISGGISWLPRGGTLQLHGAFRHMVEERSNEGAVDVENLNQNSFELGFRMML